jgi:sensor histidine kinase YesM
MVQEALANVARHSAASHADVTLTEQAGTLVVEVRDNGVGFVPARIASSGTHADEAPEEARPLTQVPDRPPAPAPVPDAAPTARTAQTRGVAGPERPTSGLGVGLGLFSMQERIALAGGTLRIDSAPGQGTVVRAVIPLTPAMPVDVAPTAAPGASDDWVAISGAPRVRA